MSVTQFSSPSSVSIAGSLTSSLANSRPNSRGRGVLVDPAVFFGDVRAALRSDTRSTARITARSSTARAVAGGATGPLRVVRPWRHQLVMAGFVAALIAAVVVGGEAASAGGGEVSERPTAPLSVVVQPGDSLWSIARHLQPQGDVRPLVDRMVKANGSAAIVAGQTIAVPLP